MNEPMLVPNGLYPLDDERDWGDPYPPCPTRPEIIAILASGIAVILYLCGLILWTL